MDLAAAFDYLRPRHHGIVVTLKRDGRPQLSNVAYALGEDGVVRVSVTASRAKTANARRDPRVSFHVTAPDFWSYVVLEGDAELTPVAARPDDATVDELVTVYRAISGSIRTGTTTAARWSPTNAWCCGSIRARAYGALPG